MHFNLCCYFVLTGIWFGLVWMNMKKQNTFFIGASFLLHHFLIPLPQLFSLFRPIAYLFQ